MLVFNRGKRNLEAERLRLLQTAYSETGWYPRKKKITESDVKAIIQRIEMRATSAVGPKKENLKRLAQRLKKEFLSE